MDLLVLGIIASIISAFIGILTALLLHNIRNRDVSKLGARVESLEMGQRGQIGRDNRALYQEELESAMVEAAAILKDDKITDKKAALIQIAAKHPNVALKMAKKLGLGI